MVDVIAKQQPDPFEGLEGYILDDNHKDEQKEAQKQEEQISEEEAPTSENSQLRQEPDLESLLNNDEGFQEAAPKSKLGGILTDISGHMMSAVWKLSPDEESEFMAHLRQGVEPLLNLLAVDDILGVLPFRKLKPVTRIILAIGIIVMFGIMYKPRHNAIQQLQSEAQESGKEVE